MRRIRKGDLLAVKTYSSGYELIRDRSGMQLINTDMQHSENAPFGHTHHIHTINYADKLVADADSKKLPRDRSIEHLQDLKRIVADKKLRYEIEELIQVKIDRQKSADYVNWQGAGV